MEFRQEKIKKIAHHYGYEEQRETLIEAAADLIHAAQECKKSHAAALDEFIDELANMKLLVDQMIVLIGANTVNDRIDEALGIMSEQVDRERQALREAGV